MPVSKTTNLPYALTRTPVATAVLLALASPALLAQEQTTLGEVVVTAQKRTENLQDVPISILALGNEQLEQLQVSNFQDYVKMLPSVTSQPGLQSGAGFASVYMRGVVTGGDGQATTSQPSVGMYLDEQPITTIQGNLDVHMYDIARVEALAGPQGTLYGASSQAGTIRIITNKPDPSGFAAGYALEGNIVDTDDTGYVAEGFVNLPVGDKAAIRLVGWTRYDAGWIDNVASTRTFPGDQSTTADDFLVSNASYAKENYNTVETYGARAALRVELNDSWTLTPTLSMQNQEGKGSWGDDMSKCAVVVYDEFDVAPGYNLVAPCPTGVTNAYQASSAAGNYNTRRFREEFTKDEWYQAGLTIEGKVGNFDLTYSANYLNRDVEGSFDYSDYAYWYDNLYTTGYFAGLFLDNAGARPNPAHTYTNQDGYTKQSHELRISSAPDKRVRAMLGFFLQKQEHDFYQQFGNVAGLADRMLMNSTVNIVNGGGAGTNTFPGVVYLNSMDREDKDKAVFGQVSFDLTDRLELTLGARYFEPEVTVRGFFGFGLGFNRRCPPGVVESGSAPACTPPIPNSDEPGAVANGGDGAYSTTGQRWSRNGEWRCTSQADYRRAPCQNVDKGISESDHIARLNLTFKATEDALLYATWSEGYRPGGINRNPFAGDYGSDFLTNWEAGWKTQWQNRRLQFNGAVFLEEWDDFQVSFTGANGITQVANGPSAEILGTEMQLLWLATDKLMLSAAAAYYDSELKDDYADFDAAGNVTGISAPAGTSLPVTPDFKGNLIARYTFDLGQFEAHLQGAYAYTGSRSSQLDLAGNAITGDIPSSSTLDLSAGIRNDKYAVDLFVQNATDEDAVVYKTSNCATNVCGYQTYGVRHRPRTIGIKFSQEF